MKEQRFPILSNISAILFDAGDTLVRPESGHWYIPPNLNRLFAAHGVPVPERGTLLSALAEGYPFLDENHYIQTEDEELEQFTSYYHIVCSALGITKGKEALHLDLARDMVLNDGKFVFYPDVMACLSRLSEAGYALGVLSNTWPSLERVFSNAGVLRFFKVFVASSQVGCFKPCPTIYRHAIEEIEVPPGEILFVDDSPVNLAGGEAEGLRPLMICRDGACEEERYACITELSQLLHA